MYCVNIEKVREHQKYETIAWLVIGVVHDLNTLCGEHGSSPRKIFTSCTAPMASQAIVSYFSNLKLFSTFTQYMSVSHGHSTMGGIEYNDGGCVEKTKKEKVSHQRG